MSDLIKVSAMIRENCSENILKLPVPKVRIDCDPTFSTGAFYRGTGIPFRKRLDDD